MCVTDYPAADEVLAAPGVLDALAGRDLRAAHQRQRGAGARAAGAGDGRRRPHAGRRHPRLPAPHRAAGDGDHVRRRRRARSRSTRRTLADLAGAQRYYGEDPGPPNAVYVAAFGFYFAALAGFLEAAALAESRGVPPGEFAAAMPGMTALLLDHIDDAARRIEDGRLRRRPGDRGRAPGRLERRRRRTLADAGLGSLMTGAFVEYCRRAAEAGEGGEDIAALFKRMRRAGRAGRGGPARRPRGATGAGVTPAAGSPAPPSVLPSGSLKKTKRPHGKSCTSPTSTPRSASSARAASASATTSCSPWTSPEPRR